MEKLEPHPDCDCIMLCPDHKGNIIPEIKRHAAGGGTLARWRCPAPDCENGRSHKFESEKERVAFVNSLEDFLKNQKNNE